MLGRVLPGLSAGTRLSRINSSMGARCLTESLSQTVYGGSVQSCNEARITVLSNGLKVASMEGRGPAFNAGVFIKAGSRYEVDFPLGISHVVEKLGFTGCSLYKDVHELHQRLENYCGSAECNAFRDCMTYNCQGLIPHLPDMIELLAATVFEPMLTESELAVQKDSIECERTGLDYKTDRVVELQDLIHQAAYRDNTLAFPEFCPKSSMDQITTDLILQYMQRLYLTDRMALVATNVDHEQLVELANKYFVNPSTSWLTLSSQACPDDSLPQYIGGEVRQHSDEPRIQPGVAELPELAHLAIGFESVPFTHPDFYAHAVLHSHLGGGHSFSAGGPGKGMYTRLYQQALVGNSWLYSCLSSLSVYNDASMFSVLSSAEPTQIGRAAQVVAKVLNDVRKGPLSESDLNRARVQLVSVLMMNMEHRAVVLEDIGKQVLFSGKCLTPKVHIQNIEAVSGSDLMAAAGTMLDSKPSVAAIGNLTSLPSYEEIQEMLLAKKTLRMPWFRS